MASGDDHGRETFVLRSDCRADVLTHLATEGPATPTQIAEDTEYRQPHVSRALTQLRDRDLIDLLVPEEQHRGRRYGLSETGETVWDQLRDGINNVEWTVEPPTTDAEREFVSLLREEFGEDLRMAGTYDGDSVRVLYADQDVLDTYSDTELERAIERLVQKYSLEDVSFPRANFRFEMKMFEEFSLLRIRDGSELQASVSFCSDHDIRVPAFARQISGIFD